MHQKLSNNISIWFLFHKKYFIHNNSSSCKIILWLTLSPSYCKESIISKRSIKMIWFFKLHQKAKICKHQYLKQRVAIAFPSKHLDFLSFQIIHIMHKLMVSHNDWVVSLYFDFFLAVVSLSFDFSSCLCLVHIARYYPVYY